MSLKILVLDIDGTLADLTHREHYVDKDDPSEEDWQNFLSPEEVKKDTPIEAAQKTISDPEFTGQFEKILFLTGRPESLRKTTKEWLNKNYSFHPSITDLWMRNDTDRRPASEVKKDLVEEIKKEYEGRELIFIDDETENLDMFSEYGETHRAPDFWKKKVAFEKYEVACLKKACRILEATGFALQAETVAPPDRVYHVSPYAAEIMEEGLIIDVSKTTLGAAHDVSYVSTTTLENAQAYKAAMQLLVGVMNGDYDYKRLMERLDEWGLQSQFHKGILEKMRARFSNLLQADKIPREVILDAAENWGGVSFDWFEHLIENKMDFTGEPMDEKVYRELLFRGIQDASFYPNDRIPCIFGSPWHLADRSQEDVQILEVLTAPVENPCAGEDEELRSLWNPLPGEEEETKGKYTYAPGEKEWRFYDETDLLPIRIIE